jgi:hypothetical protein
MPSFAQITIYDTNSHVRHARITQSLVQGKLDQKSKSLVVKFAVGRDTQNVDIDLMIQKLTSWYDASSVGFTPAIC